MHCEKESNLSIKVHNLKSIHCEVFFWGTGEGMGGGGIPDKILGL
jgi:hypothetical protein